MKKTILIAALVVLALGVFGVGAVLAQDGTPPFSGHAPMMQSGSMGVMHTFMVTEFARKLDLNVNDINTRLNAGESMYDIAISAGVSAEEFPVVMAEVRANALGAAVKANVITQAQADLMKSHGFGQGGMGIGDCSVQGGNGQRGMMNGWGTQQINP